MQDTSTIHSTTQQYLDIHDVVNDFVVMKDGATSLILVVDAINFGLLAEEEQDAIMYAYAGLLNSLNFPIQVVIRSQTKDVSGYLRLLDEQIENTFDEFKKQQIRSYRTFVSELIKERNVLDKKFYVVLPASALELGLVSPQSVVPGVKNKQAVDLDLSQILDKAVAVLHPKRDHLINQFARIGLFSRQLTTQEIIRLYYVLYNPEAAEGQEITHTRNYTTAVVTARRSEPMVMPQVPLAAPAPQYQPVAPVQTPAPQQAQYTQIPQQPQAQQPAPAPIQQVVQPPLQQPVQQLTQQTAPVQPQVEQTESIVRIQPVPAITIQSPVATPAHNGTEVVTAQAEAQDLIDQSIGTGGISTTTEYPDLPPPAEI